MKVLYVASEVVPFSQSGGLADVAGSLPKAIRDRAVSCRVVSPLYGSVPQSLRETMKFIGHIEVQLAWRRQYCGVFSCNLGGVVHYFIDNEYYFARDGLYGHFDDGERFAFFSKAVLAILPLIDYFPDIIHLNDWQTALVPLYLKAYYQGDERYRRIRTVFTIHNILYQGRYGFAILGDVFDLPDSFAEVVSYDGCINLMKGAIQCADRVTTVSPTYAQEILDPWYADGLDRYLRTCQWKLSGILNGLDTKSYDPAADPVIAHPYTAETLEGKALDKQALRQDLGLAESNEPIVALVTRLVAHKGLDLVKYIFNDMMRLGIQLVVLGSGDSAFEDFFYSMQQIYPNTVRAILGFVPEMARKIYAGADIFLMPSKTEPCGLSQMIAMRYGTIPIVRETGGLKDTVLDAGDPSGEGDGYTFKTYNAHDMLGALDRAVGAYHLPEVWQGLQKRAMTKDFSWGRSAAQYIELYKGLLEA